MHESGCAVDIQKPLLLTGCWTSLLTLTITEGSKVLQHPAVWGRQILSEAHWDAGWGHLAEWQGQHILPAKEELRPEPTRLAPACNPPNIESSLIRNNAVAPSRSTRSIVSWWHWGLVRSEVSMSLEGVMASGKYVLMRTLQAGLSDHCTKAVLYCTFYKPLTPKVLPAAGRMFKQKHSQFADSYPKPWTIY